MPAGQGWRVRPHILLCSCILWFYVYIYLSIAPCIGCHFVVYVSILITAEANTPFVHIQSKCFDGRSERPPSLLEALSHCIPRQTSVIPCGLPQYKYTKFLLDQLHIKIIICLSTLMLLLSKVGLLLLLQLLLRVGVGQWAWGCGLWSRHSQQD